MTSLIRHVIRRRALSLHRECATSHPWLAGLASRASVSDSEDGNEDACHCEPRAHNLPRDFARCLEIAESDKLSSEKTQILTGLLRNPDMDPRVVACFADAGKWLQTGETAHFVGEPAWDNVAQALRLCGSSTLDREQDAQALPGNLDCQEISKAPLPQASASSSITSRNAPEARSTGHDHDAEAGSAPKPAYAPKPQLRPEQMPALAHERSDGKSPATNYRTSQGVVTPLSACDIKTPATSKKELITTCQPDDTDAECTGAAGSRGEGSKRCLGFDDTGINAMVSGTTSTEDTDVASPSKRACP